jgi:hypothetical protein
MDAISAKLAVIAVKNSASGLVTKAKKGLGLDKEKEGGFFGKYNKRFYIGEIILGKKNQRKMR